MTTAGASSGKAIPGNANLPIGGRTASQETGAPRAGYLPGWHSRGYLPHFDDVETTQHVTFHLADSLPREVAQRLRDEVRRLPLEKQDVEWRKRVEAWIDSGYGSCVLRELEVAEMAQNAFFYFDGERYRLLEWVVMPNHVHVLFQPINGWTVAQTVASWKKYTARGITEFRRRASQETGGPRSGSGGASQETGVPREEPSPVWHREYWDRFIRNERHFQQAVEYIRQNPVKAALVRQAEDWRWSSAAARGCGSPP